MDAFDYFREQRFKKLKRNHPSLTEEIIEKVISREWGQLSPKSKNQFNIIMEIVNSQPPKTQSDKPETTQRTQVPPQSSSKKVQFEFAGKTYQASPFFVYYNNKRISTTDKSPEFQDYVHQVREENFYNPKPDQAKVDQKTKLNEKQPIKTTNKKLSNQFDNETEDDEKYNRKSSVQQQQPQAWIRIDFDFEEKDGVFNTSSGLIFMSYVSKKFFVSQDRVYILDKLRKNYREVDTSNYKSQFHDKLAHLRDKVSIQQNLQQIFEEGAQQEEQPMKVSIQKPPSVSAKIASQKQSVRLSRTVQSDDSLTSSDDDSLSVSQARITTADEPQKREKSPAKEQPMDENEEEKLMILRKFEEVQKRKEAFINVEEEPVSLVKEQHSLNNSRMLTRAFMVKTEATYERQGLNNQAEDQQSKRRVRDAQPIEKPSKKLTDSETGKPLYHFVMKVPKGSQEYRKYYNLAKDNLERMWPTSSFEQETGGDSFEIVLNLREKKHKIWKGSVTSRNVDEVISAVESLRV